MAIAFSSHQSVRQHPTTGVRIHPLEINEIRGRNQSLLKQWLAGGPFQERLGLDRQRRQKNLADQIKKLSAARRLEILKIRAGSNQF